MTELLFCTEPVTPAQLQTQHQLEYINKQQDSQFTT